MLYEEEKSMIVSDASTGGFATKPLRRGSSHSAMSANYRTEINAGKPKRQAVAIMLDQARRTGRGRNRPKPPKNGKKD